MKMNENDALELIETMINSAKKEVRENGFYFMFWGWLVFAGAAADYIMLKFIDTPVSDYHSMAWAILMPLGGIITGIFSMRKKKEVRVKTYLDNVMSYAVRAFAISLFVACLLMPQSGNMAAFYPVLMIIYALWLYIAGGALKFKPLIYGAYINWLLAAFAFFSTYDVQLIFLALAVLLGYIIPGHILRSRFNLHVQGA